MSPASNLPRARMLLVFALGLATAFGAVAGQDALPDELEREITRIRAMPKAKARARLSVVLEAVRRLRVSGDTRRAAKLARWTTTVDRDFAPGHAVRAELALDAGRAAEAKRLATQVLEIAVDDPSREAATRILELDPIPAMAPLDRVPGDEAALVLVAMGDVDRSLLVAVRERLDHWIRIPVVLQHGDVHLPASDENPWAEELERLREMIRAEWNEGLSGVAARVRVPRIAIGGDQAVARLAGAWLLDRARWRELSDFEAGLHRDHRPLWIAGRLTRLLASAIGPYARDRVRFLGITRGAMLSERRRRPVRGWGGENLGVVSYAQFLPSARDEAPNWDKLVERLTKQALCTAGEVLQCRRCRNRTCPMHLGRRETFERFDKKRAAPCEQCESTLQIVE